MRAGLAFVTAVVALAACKHDATLRGTVKQGSKGVAGTSLTLECPDGTRRETFTATGGEFRFEDLGASVDDGCQVQAHLSGWVPTQTVGSRCTRRDAAGLCAEAQFAFEVP